MINNKDSFTFKKYLSNKKLIKFFYIFLLIDTVAFFCLLMKFYFSGYYKYPLVATMLVLFFLIIFHFVISKADRELIKGKKRNYFTWGRGAGAELIVKKSLMSLNDYYRVISDFHPGEWNIDHICIGPTGIFAIEVKAHKGTISYSDGKLKRNNQELGNFLGQAKEGSVFLNQLIKERLNKDYFVVPVLVFPNANIDNSINHQIENVWVGGRGFERWVVDNCKNVLSLEEINTICNFLERLDYNEKIDNI
ncbi:MAG: nuclease-related domain-containing protein [Candidatus Paceibacterota bacterium]|jgi:hypothetical protein